MQLTVTSPPYNLGKAYERRESLEDYLASQRQAIAECVRVTRSGGSICWQVGPHIDNHGQVIPLDLLLYPLFAAHQKSDALRLRNRIVWQYAHGLHCIRRFSGRYEVILWFTKGDDYVFHLDPVRVPQKYPGKRSYKGSKRGAYSGNPLGKNPGDVWDFPSVKSSHVEKTIHPCQFPVELPARLVLALSNAGDLILDPFLGSGTTAVAAVLHGRRAAGSDVIKEYVDIARKRVIHAARGTLRIRPLGREIILYSPNSDLTTPPPGFRFPRSPGDQLACPGIPDSQSPVPAHA